MEKFLQLILVVVQRWYDIVASGIVVQYVEFASCDLSDALVECAYGFLVGEFEG